MTILEPLVHLYQKLRRCCRHNNIKIFFFCSFVLLTGLGRNFFPSQFHSFVVANSSSSHRDMRGDTQTIQQTTPVGSRETANGKLTWEILTGKKKNTSHMTLNLLLVLLNDCVIIHIRGLHCKVLWFLSHPLADYVRFKAGISGVKKTSTQSALKRSSLKTTQDIKRQVSHLNMIGCHLTCWVYGKHQGHHHLEHYTSAIKSASGQYQVIGPIQEVLDAF